jgi:peptidoglycan lytic transglycosylase
MKISSIEKNCFYWLALGAVLAFFIGILGCSGGSGTGPVSAEAGIESERSNVAPVVEPVQVQRGDPQPAGRAFEAGDIEKALALADGLGDTPAELLLRARLAYSQKDNETAVQLYHQLTDRIPGFEPRRVLELSKALAAAGRQDEAASHVLMLLGPNSVLSEKERLEAMKERALWLVSAGQTDQAIQTYESIVAQEDNTARRDRVRLDLTDALFADGNEARARTILEELALKAGSGAVMRMALARLGEHGIKPVWNFDQRLSRVNILMGHRAWSAALSTLKPLLKKGSGTTSDEAHWLEARIQFKRRRHYSEALEVLEPIAQGKGVHSDDARLLLARALSRMDRDPEAIKAYRHFATKTKRPAKATEARFFAARLEYYLGRHKAALRSFEKLVGSGKGKVPKNGIAEAGRRRDAHFLAGLSSLLSGNSKKAEPHFSAASIGTSNAEVLARNEYWEAVAQTESRKKSGFEGLRKICRDDPTAWYARMAASRLAGLGEDAQVCEIKNLGQVNERQTVKPLKEFSPYAAFLARAGFFREASSELRIVEKSGTVNADVRDWVVNYNALDAPHYAVRRASLGLSWPPSKEEFWRAQAAYPSPYRVLVRETEKQLDLPSGLIWAIARKESLFDPRAVSGVGAMGMMQMMPQTYETNRKRAGLPPLKEGRLPGPEPSIRAAGYEFDHLLKRFGSLPLAIMAYNAGPAAVSRWLDRSGGLPIDVFVEKAGFAQTRNYVRRVYRSLIRYRQLLGEPLPQLPPKAELPPKEISKADGGLDK